MIPILTYFETHDPFYWETVKQEVQSQFLLGSHSKEIREQFSTDTPSSVTGNGSTAFQGILNALNGKIYLYHTIPPTLSPSKHKREP
ncbi:hypothetical protein P3G55_09825 [Leptospira sp. 96542]|nr:hypothetical protein [Leptospira sp. 96542]